MNASLKSMNAVLPRTEIPSSLVPRGMRDTKPVRISASLGPASRALIASVSGESLAGTLRLTSRREITPSSSIFTKKRLDWRDAVVTAGTTPEELEGSTVDGVGRIELEVEVGAAGVEILLGTVDTTDSGLAGRRVVLVVVVALSLRISRKRVLSRAFFISGNLTIKTTRSAIKPIMRIKQPGFEPPDLRFFLDAMRKILVIRP